MSQEQLYTEKRAGLVQGWAQDWREASHWRVKPLTQKLHAPRTYAFSLRARTGLERSILAHQDAMFARRVSEKRGS